MNLLIIPKFGEDWIKITRVNERSYWADTVTFLRSKASNFEVENPIWPKFQLIWDMWMCGLPANVVKIWKKKTNKKHVIEQTTEESNLTWPEFKLFQDFMDELNTCKFQEYWIKNKYYMYLADNTIFAFKGK